MSAWASTAPVIGTGSLDGFAIGALISGACALAITAPWRARRPAASRGGAQAAERNGWLCEHVMAAEAAGFGLAAEAVAVAASAVRIESSAAGAERLTRPEEVGAKGTGRSAVGRYRSAAGGYRSRRRRGDPIPLRAHRDSAHRDSAHRDSAHRDSAPRDSAPRDRASPASASEPGVFAGSVALQSPFPDSACPRIRFAGGRSRRDAHPDIEFSDAELALVRVASPRRPEARRLPRHAAPSIGLGSRITGIRSRMTGLFATRALASGARG